MLPIRQPYARAPSPLLGSGHTLDMMQPIQRKRASSFKKPRETIGERLLDDEIRPRTCSMPTRNALRKPNLMRTRLGLHLDPESETYPVRTFKINSKGVIVDRGDSLRSRSTNSILSSEGEIMPLSPSSRTSSSMSRESVEISPGSHSQAQGLAVPLRVLVVGSPGVGKTAITQQFLTSEYLGGFNTSIDYDCEKPVNILLNGEETALAFQIQTERQPLEDDLDNVACYVIVYACDDKRSFDEAVDLLYKLRQQQHREEIIMFVGNKSDLVRSRSVTTEEAKAVAMTYDCKFVETSVVLNINVDELLVGIVKQIRIRNADGGDKCAGCTSTSKLLLNRLFKRDSISKSCENLYA